MGISSSGRGRAEGLKQKGWKMGAAPSSRGGGGLGCGDKPGSFMLALIALGLRCWGDRGLCKPRVPLKSFRCWEK